MPDQVNYANVKISLATQVNPPEDPPDGLFTNSWPGIRIHYRDNAVVAKKAAGHYQFELGDIPSNWTSAKVVDMAFKKTSPAPEGDWTRVGQQGDTRPFWVVRWANDPSVTQGIGINDVPTQHAPGQKVAEDYDVMLVIEFTKENDTTHHTICDPEIHNQQAM